MTDGIFKTALQAVLRTEGDRIMEELKSKTPVWYEGRLAGWDTGAMKRSSSPPAGSHATNPFVETARRSRWSTPELGSIGNPFPKGYEPRKTHHAFICEYCGRASQSVEPCQGCGASTHEATTKPTERRCSDVEYYARAIDIDALIHDTVTITVSRQSNYAITLTDVANMFESFTGDNPVWIMSRQAMSSLVVLNGPRANPSYVFTQAQSMEQPSMLLGMPIVSSAKSPHPGATGDVVLIDWKQYHRLDGCMWPDTIPSGDGFSSSPCVILGDV